MINHRAPSIINHQSSFINHQSSSSIITWSYHTHIFVHTRPATDPRARISRIIQNQGQDSINATSQKYCNYIETISNQHPSNTNTTPKQYKSQTKQHHNNIMKTSETNQVTIKTISKQNETSRKLKFSITRVGK